MCIRDSADGTDRLGEPRIEFVKNRFSDPCRKSFDAAFDNAAGRIALCHQFVQISGGSLCRVKIWHIKFVFGYCLKMIVRFRDGNRSDRFRKGQKLYAKLPQQKRGDRTARDTSDGLTTGRTTAAAVIADAVFGVKCIVGMSRTCLLYTSRCV